MGCWAMCSGSSLCSRWCSSARSTCCQIWLNSCSTMPGGTSNWYFSASVSSRLRLARARLPGRTPARLLADRRLELVQRLEAVFLGQIVADGHLRRFLDLLDGNLEAGRPALVLLAGVVLREGQLDRLLFAGRGAQQLLLEPGMNCPIRDSREKPSAVIPAGARRRPAGPRNRSPTRSPFLRRTLHRGEGLFCPASRSSVSSIWARRPRPPAARPRGSPGPRPRSPAEPRDFILYSSRCPCQLDDLDLRLHRRDAARAPRWSPLVASSTAPSRTSPITEIAEALAQDGHRHLARPEPRKPDPAAQAPPAGWSRVFRMSAAGTPTDDLELALQPFGAGFGDLHRTQGLFGCVRAAGSSGRRRLIFPVPDRKAARWRRQPAWSSSPPGRGGDGAGAGGGTRTPHDFRHWNLNPARLPVPPRPPDAPRQPRSGHATRPAGPTAPRPGTAVAPRGRQPPMSGVAASDPSGGL